MRVWDAHPWARGRGVAVAVVDTGVHRRHPDLAGRVAELKDFVGHGSTAELHGTAVAGVIASGANNGIGTVGVAPEARILALRACWEAPGSGSSGHCNSFTLAKALDWVVTRRPEVLNLSLTGPQDPLLERLLRAVLDEDIKIVAAYENGSGPGSFPGSVEGVLLTRSPDETAFPGVSAPGQDILAAAPGDGFDFVSGNSFAAAHVSGVVALLLERAPSLGMDEIRQVLETTSRNSIIDACAALAAVDPDAACGHSATPQQP
jgi:subtilisin family serine protease